MVLSGGGIAPPAPPCCGAPATTQNVVLPRILRSGRGRRVIINSKALAWSSQEKKVCIYVLLSLRVSLG